MDVEALVGDAEYDTSARLAFDLEARYGIHPVFPLRGTVRSQWEHGENSASPSVRATAS